MKPVLHVGVVIGSNTPAAWIVKILQAVESHDLMNLQVFVQNTCATKHAESAKTDSASGKQRSAGSLDDWIIHNVIDYPHFKDNPWQAEAIPEGIVIASLAKELQADDLQTLDSCDVLVYLCENSSAQLLSDLQTPVWSAEFPSLDARIKRCLLHREPFIWIHLWCGSERIASHSLPCQSYSISDLRRLTFSALPRVVVSRLIWLANSTEYKLDPIEVQESRTGVFDKEIHLARQDSDRAFVNQKNNKELSANMPVGGIASFVGFMAAPVVVPSGKAVLLLLRKTYERLHHKLFTEHWQLAVSLSNQTQSLKSISETPVHEFTGIDAGKDVMWADPHLCEHESDTYVFFERKHTHNENAHIAWMKLDRQGQRVADGTALKTDFHLSFPFIFKHEGNWFMIPETASQRTVSLYRATRFPDQWEFHSTLLDNINAADTVVFEYEERWWMFTNCQSHRSVDERDELHVYHAEHPEGPWQAHVLNPVVTGVDRSRMAGPVMHEKGSIYRPSQYGAYRYGYGINISRIDILTPSQYRESAELRILPISKAGWSGCHSIGRIGNIGVIDRVRFSRR